MMSYLINVNIRDTVYCLLKFVHYYSLLMLTRDKHLSAVVLLSFSSMLFSWDNFVYLCKLHS